MAEQEPQPDAGAGKAQVLHEVGELDLLGITFVGPGMVHEHGSGQRKGGHHQGGEIGIDTKDQPDPTKHDPHPRNLNHAPGVRHTSRFRIGGEVAGLAEVTEPGPKEHRRKENAPQQQHHAHPSSSFFAFREW